LSWRPYRLARSDFDSPSYAGGFTVVRTRPPVKQTRTIEVRAAQRIAGPAPAVAAVTARK